MPDQTWFNVDRKGLQKLALRRGFEYVLFELYQNAADTETKDIEMWFQHVGGRKYQISCLDQDPDGFKDLSHAYTMFADSEKKSDPTKRGRFNLGEKLVLACCYRAQIATTTGTVTFNEDGTRDVKKRSGREAGSFFAGDIKNLIQFEDYQQAVDEFNRLIPKKGTTVRLNGTPIMRPKLLRSVTARLQTHIANADGLLVRTERETTVDIYEPKHGWGWIYEMGIPVVETGDKYSYDVQQKVPVSLDRDNVPPGYLKKLRTVVFNEMWDNLTPDDVNSSLVKDATESSDVLSGAVNHFVDLKFGTKRVIYDPSDAEANKLAVVQGYQVAHGGTLSKEQWDNVRKAGAMLPAGQVTPSPKPFSPGGKPLALLKEITSNHRRLEKYVRFMAWQSMAVEVSVIWANDAGWGFAGCYAKSSPLSPGVIHINVAAFESGTWTGSVNMRIDDFLIHEFGHEHCGDHLDERYHADLTRLGAAFKDIAVRQPEKLKEFYDI